jgi:hypothetical protein
MLVPRSVLLDPFWRSRFSLGILVATSATLLCMIFPGDFDINPPEICESFSDQVEVPISLKYICCHFQAKFNAGLYAGHPTTGTHGCYAAAI